MSQFKMENPQILVEGRVHLFCMTLKKVFQLERELQTIEIMLISSKSCQDFKNSSKEYFSAIEHLENLKERCCLYYSHCIGLEDYMDYDEEKTHFDVILSFAPKLFIHVTKHCKGITDHLMLLENTSFELEKNNSAFKYTMRDFIKRSIKSTTDKCSDIIVQYVLK